MRRDQRLELTDHRGVAPERELHLDAILDCSQTELLKARGLSLSERAIGNLGQRRPPPQRQGLVEENQRVDGLTITECAPARLDQPREPIRVELVGLDLKDVAGRPRDEPVPRVGRGSIRLKELPQLRDIHVHHLRGALRRVFAPEVIYQLASGNNLIRVQEKAREQGLLPRSTRE